MLSRTLSSKSCLQVACTAVLAAVAVATIPCTASAQTISSWTGGGGSGDWATTSNWGATATPNTSGTFDLIFRGTTQTTTTNSIGTVNVSSIQFLNNNSAGQTSLFTIRGSTLVLSSATISTVAAASGSPFGTNSDGDTIAAPLTLAGTSTVITNNLHNLTLSGNISGTGAIVYDDGSIGTTEFVYISGSNSYSGGTVIKGGFAQTGARGAAASNDFAFGTGPVTVSDNGSLLLRNNSIISNPLTVSGLGSGTNPLTNSPLVGSFGTAGGTAEYRGDITLAGPARFSTASAASGDTTSRLLVSGNVNLGSNLLTLLSRPASTSGSIGLLVDVTGTIAGTGGVNVEALNSQGRARISGSNSYSGGTTITTGTLIVGNGSALGTGFLAVNTSGLDLNGQTLGVGALSGSAAGVILSTNGPATLTTTAATDSTYNGTITNGSGTVGLTKAGAGVLTLTGSNNYTGATGVNGGVIALDNQAAIGSSGAVTFGGSGGTLRYSASNQVDYSARFASSSAAISVDTNGQTVSYDSAIASTNVGGLTKSGSGTLFLNGANQYAGSTAVNAGTLSGTGSVLGLLSVQPGAVFDPGSSPTATAIFGVGSFSLANGGTTRMQVNGTAAGSLYDQVLFTGPSPAVSWGGLLDITLSGSYANYTDFNLFSGFTSATGDLSGISFAAPGSPYAGLGFSGPVGGVWTTGTTEAGQYLTFNQSTGVLAVVPEPTSMGMAAVGAGLCGVNWFRRRRRAANG